MTSFIVIKEHILLNFVTFNYVLTLSKYHNKYGNIPIQDTNGVNFLSLSHLSVSVLVDVPFTLNPGSHVKVIVISYTTP